MDTIEAKAKVILPKNSTTSLSNVGNVIDKTSGSSNNLNNDRSTQNRNGEIIVLQHYTEERVISLTILSILFALLIIIAISFIYIYICKKYFRKECFRDYLPLLTSFTDYWRSTFEYNKNHIL